MEKKINLIFELFLLFFVLLFASFEVKAQKGILLKEVFQVFHYLDKTNYVPANIGDIVTDSLLKHDFQIYEPPTMIYNTNDDSLFFYNSDTVIIDCEISDYTEVYKSIETPSIFIIPENDSIRFGILKSILTQNKHHGFIYFNNNSDEVILIVNCESFSDRIIEDNKTFFITCYINKEFTGYFTYIYGDVNYGFGKYCALENGESVIKYITTEEDLNRISINEATSLSELINGFILINQKLPKNNGCACLTYYCDMKSKLFDIIKKWP